MSGPWLGGGSRVGLSWDCRGIETRPLPHGSCWFMLVSEEISPAGWSQQVWLDFLHGTSGRRRGKLPGS